MLGTLIQFRGNTFVKRRNLCDSHQELDWLDKLR